MSMEGWKEAQKGSEGTHRRRETRSGHNAFKWLTNWGFDSFRRAKYDPDNKRSNGGKAQKWNIMKTSSTM